MKAAVDQLLDVMSVFSVADSRRLLICNRAAAAVRASIPRRRRGVWTHGGAEAADAQPGGGAARQHAGWG